MEYLSISQTADKWGISKRRIRYYAHKIELWEQKK